MRPPHSAWIWLLLLPAGIVTAVENPLPAVETPLPGLGTGFLHNGFDVVSLATTGQLLGFVGISFAFDVGLQLLIWSALRTGGDSADDGLG